MAILNTIVLRRFGPLSTTQYLNVDLEIYSKHDLQPLVDRLGLKVTALYVGRDHGKYSAHLEVSKITKTADSTIREFCALIEKLPQRERSLWNKVTVRSFSIGIQAGTEPRSCDFTIRPATVRAISGVGAQIVLTIYAV